MRVGDPTEVNNHEFRVAITPAGVREPVQHRHHVFVQAGADLGSPTSSDEYVVVGSILLDHADDSCGSAEKVLKVNGAGRRGGPTGCARD